MSTRAMLPRCFHCSITEKAKTSLKRLSNKKNPKTLPTPKNERHVLEQDGFANLPPSLPGVLFKTAADPGLQSHLPRHAMTFTREQESRKLRDRHPAANGRKKTSANTFVIIRECVRG